MEAEMTAKLIVLNGTGHTEVIEDKKTVALKLFEEGYQFWTNVAEKGVELGDVVPVGTITDEQNLVAMKPIAGG